MATESSRSDRSSYLEHLHLIKSGQCDVEGCTDFNNGLSWINTTEPLSFNSNLRGKLVVLDFWTYCCINCIHILPDLHETEEKYHVEDGVVIIGVHSAKFPNEKVLLNIENAVKRYGINHAVVNDGEAVLWNKMNIQCWPSLVVVGPHGEILTTFIGEGHKEELWNFLDCALDVFKDSISGHSLPISVGTSTGSHVLRFPGKVLVQHDSVYIADTGNHRIIICSPDGVVKAVVGSGQAGHCDGPSHSASFIAPQGMCVVNSELYVVDSDSHHLRKINLSDFSVTTVAGMGKLGSDKLGGGQGLDQIISSPWDVKPLASQHGEVDMLLIAMAGTHQIWAYFLQDTVWWKSQKYATGCCAAIVGSGNEENRNNSYPMKSGLAQPSGLSIDGANKLCYVADSESSTVRQLNLSTGQVKGLVGGARDPMDLFAYGDADGKGIDVKLQHPLDVCVIPGSNFVLVCDSYNHKVKQINTKTKECVTLSVSSLDEPSGLSYSEEERAIYIADTNNHRIVKCGMTESESRLTLTALEWEVRLSDNVDSPVKPLFNHGGRSVVKVTRDPICIGTAHTTITVKVDQLPDDCHMTEDVASSWRAILSGTDSKPAVSGDLVSAAGDKNTVIARIPVSNLSSGQELKLTVEALVYFCHDSDGVCKRKCVLIEQLVKIQ